MTIVWNDPPPAQNPLQVIATLIVDALVANGTLKDAESLRREGAERERARQKKKQSAAAKRKEKKKPARKTSKKKRKGSG